MTQVKFEDFDDEENLRFARCGRLYEDMGYSIIQAQEEYIGTYPDERNEVIVVATRKWRLHPTRNWSHMATNYSSDCKPYGEVAIIRGERSLKPEREILWAR